MIKYKIDIMQELKKAGYTSYKLRNDKIFGEATITKFRKKEYINFNNLDILCKLLNCQPADIIEYRTNNGKFKTINDLKKIKGIGKAKFDAIKDKITVK